MNQLGFKDGYVTDPEEMDNRLKAYDNRYQNPENNPGYLESIQGLLSQVQQVKNAGTDPALMGQMAGAQKVGIAPQMAQALAQLSASAGSLGGQTADASPVGQFAQSMEQQRREQAALGGQQIKSAREARLADLQNKLAMAKAIRGEQKYAQEFGLKQKQMVAQQQKQAREEKRKEEQFARQQQKDLSEQEYKDRMLAFKESEAEEKRQLAAKKKKQPSGAQAAAAGFGRRIEAANDIFERLSSKGFDRTSMISGFMDYFAPEAMKSSDLQEQNQAERNFINAVLRRESGAAISPTEFESAELQYFPRAGDSAQVLANKAQNRMQTLAALRAEASDFWEQVPAIAYQEARPDRGMSLTETAYADSTGSQNELDEVGALMQELRDKAAAGDKEAQAYLDSLGG